MMGSGKSTIGQLVAERTGMKFIDTDKQIERQQGTKISDIFATEGEEAFRDLETALLRELEAVEDTVIATGGGIVIREGNRELLKSLGTVMFLDASPEVLLERIGDTDSRPILKEKDPLIVLRGLARSRRSHYGEAAHLHLDTEELTVDEIADKIIEEVLAGRRADHRPRQTDFRTIIAIDGPVASGKSTTARHLARSLGYSHVDTGAMYRCVAFEALRRDVDLTDREDLEQIALRIAISFALDPDHERGQRVLLDGEDVTDSIRSPEVSVAASRVADVPGVRLEMSRSQRELALRGNAVLEGRDIGTVVVPEAFWKFYVTASIEERTRRRFREYELTHPDGEGFDARQVRADIIARDNRDRTRYEGALKLHPRATVIDTTGVGTEELVALIATMVRAGIAEP
jgi:cytidylate kinase